MKYSRILLKLSGEALMGEKGFGIDSSLLEKYSNFPSTTLKFSINPNWLWMIYLILRDCNKP